MVVAAASLRDDLLLPPIEEMPNGTIASMHMVTIRYTRRRHRNVGDSPTLLDVGDIIHGLKFQLFPPCDKTATITNEIMH